MSYLHSSSHPVRVPARSYYHRTLAECETLVYPESGLAFAAFMLTSEHDEGTPMVTGGDLQEVGMFAAYLTMGV